MVKYNLKATKLTLLLFTLNTVVKIPDKSDTLLNDFYLIITTNSTPKALNQIAARLR